jgi:hypothetical protein
MVKELTTTRATSDRWAALTADDPRARCALHQQHGSIGICSRCGSFCCVLCAPAAGLEAGAICLPCQALPQVRAHRRQRASLHAALWLLVVPTAFVAAAFVAPFDLKYHLALLGGFFAPFVVLAALQARVRSAWPTVASVVPWVLLGVPQVVDRNWGVLWLAIPFAATFRGWWGIRRAARLEEPPASSPGQKVSGPG